MKSIFFILAFVLCISFTFAQKKSEAKISKEQATKTVLASIKDGKIESSELEKEDGKLIWSFDVKVAKKIQEVWVDANSGVIIKTETESPKDEINEKAMDKAEKIALELVPYKEPLKVWVFFSISVGSIIFSTFIRGSISTLSILFIFFITFFRVSAITFDQSCPSHVGALIITNQFSAPWGACPSSIFEVILIYIVGSLQIFF